MSYKYETLQEQGASREPLEDGAGTYVAPQTELERLISEAWKDVLRIGQVGVTDNFFDLGGHSLAMAKLHDRLSDSIKAHLPGKELNLVEMFEHPTVRSLARHLTLGGSNEPGFDRVRGLAQKQKAAQQRQKSMSQGRKPANE